LSSRPKRSGGICSFPFRIATLKPAKPIYPLSSHHCATPDFLSNLVGSASFMRLSLRKAAHAALSTAAQQEIRVRSVENIPKKGPRNCRSLGFPGFPVELGVISELHAAFLNESRTRGPLWCRAVGNPGCAPPGFLLRSVGSSNYMRLSSPKGAHAAVSGAA
jgi:hypothetical protein